MCNIYSDISIGMSSKGRIEKFSCVLGNFTKKFDKGRWIQFATIYKKFPPFKQTKDIFYDKRKELNMRYDILIPNYG